MTSEQYDLIYNFIKNFYSNRQTVKKQHVIMRGNFPLTFC